MEGSIKKTIKFVLFSLIYPPVKHQNRAVPNHNTFFWDLLVLQIVRESSAMSPHLFLKMVID